MGIDAGIMMAALASIQEAEERKQRELREKQERDIRIIRMALAMLCLHCWKHHPGVNSEECRTSEHILDYGQLGAPSHRLEF